MGFYIKKIIAYIFNLCGISNLLLFLEHKRYGNKYIRIINYHDTKQDSVANLKKQLLWFKDHYRNVTFREFERFLSHGVLEGEKPGIMLTFDDGLSGNYEHAKAILNELNMTGYFMVSSDLIGKKGYMNVEQIKELISEGHIIGCHTSTHHRMDIKDDCSTLEYEIVSAKNKLEDVFGVPISIFCWCGGEENTYTLDAQIMIEKAGYEYGFMTNSKPMTKETDRFHIQRTNVEDDWPIALVKFQVSGILDCKFARKRRRVNSITHG